jgi:hypothetical protein
MRPRRPRPVRYDRVRHFAHDDGMAEISRRLDRRHDRLDGIEWRFGTDAA